MERCINDLNMTELSICYGMTETSPVSFQTFSNDTIEHRTSTVGKVISFK